MAFGQRLVQSLQVGAHIPSINPAHVFFRFLGRLSPPHTSITTSFPYPHLGVPGRKRFSVLFGSPPVTTHHECSVNYHVSLRLDSRQHRRVVWSFCCSFVITSRVMKHIFMDPQLPLVSQCHRQSLVCSASALAVFTLKSPGYSKSSQYLGVSPRIIIVKSN
jgi:hypothetical protein